MKRALVFLYGMICYAITLATFAYMANFLVPRAIDSAPQVPLGQTDSGNKLPKKCCC